MSHATNFCSKPFLELSLLTSTLTLKKRLRALKFSIRKEPRFATIATELVQQFFVALEDFHPKQWKVLQATFRQSWPISKQISTTILSTRTSLRTLHCCASGEWQRMLRHRCQTRFNRLSGRTMIRGLYLLTIVRAVQTRGEVGATRRLTSLYHCFLEGSLSRFCAICCAAPTQAASLQEKPFFRRLRHALPLKMLSKRGLLEPNVYSKPIRCVFLLSSVAVSTGSTVLTAPAHLSRASCCVDVPVGCIRERYCFDYQIL